MSEPTFKTFGGGPEHPSYWILQPPRADQVNMVRIEYTWEFPSGSKLCAMTYVDPELLEGGYADRQQIIDLTLQDMVTELLKLWDGTDPGARSRAISPKEDN